MPARRDHHSAEYIRSLFRYENGRLYWKERPREHFVNEHRKNNWNSHFAGKEAGYRSETSRWLIGIDNSRYMRHHIVWVIHHGYWPEMLDHKDRDGFNDRIENLRPCTASQNQGNKSKSRCNASGFKGVILRKSCGIWRAQIKINGKNKYLGYFRTPEEAAAAYARAAKEKWGEFACDS